MVLLDFSRRFAAPHQYVHEKSSLNLFFSFVPWKKRSYGFGTTKGRINDDRFVFTFLWTVSLIIFHSLDCFRSSVDLVDVTI